MASAVSLVVLSAILIGTDLSASANGLPPAPTVTSSLASGSPIEAGTFTTFDVVIENTNRESIEFTATSNYLNFTVVGLPTSTCPGFPDASLASGASCTISWAVQAGPAQGPGEPADAFVRVQPWFDNGAGGSSNATVIVIERTTPLPPPPVVSSSFAAGETMYERQTTTFDIVIDNTAGSEPASTAVSISIQGFDNPPPEGQLTTTCFRAGGSFSVGAGDTCTISRKVIARRAGNASAQARLSRYNLLTSSSIVILPPPVPVLAAEFDSPVEAFEPAPVTVTFDHTAGVLDVAEIDVTVRPSGELTILPTPVESTCAGTVPEVDRNEIRVQAVPIAAGESCAVTFQAVAQTPNVYELRVSGDALLDDPDLVPQRRPMDFVRKDIIVLPSSVPISPPEATLEYSELVTPLTRQLTLRLDNGANSRPALGVQAILVTDNRVMIEGSTIESSCAGELTLLPPELTLINGTIGAGQACEISMIVSSPTPGSFQLSGGASGSTGQTNSVRAAFSLGDSVLEIATAFVPPRLDVGETGELLVTVRRPTTGPTSTIDLTVTIPTGVTVEDTFSTNCGGQATITQFQFIEFFGGTLEQGATCSLIFRIASQTEGTYETFASIDTQFGPVPSRVAILRVGAICGSPDIIAQPGVPVFGTAASEVILGTPGPDLIDGGGGNDIICGLGGDDRLIGGPGNDMIFGDAGRDLITGGHGRDEISGGSQIDRIYGQGGNDVLMGDGGSDRIRAGDGNDLVLAGSGADRVWGGPGDDELRGMGGQDRMWGEAGDDNLQGNWQSDRLWGGPGNDRVAGAQGKDIIYGGNGNDALFGGNNTDFLDGGPGTDTADGQKGKDNPLVPGVSGCIAETQTSC